MGVSVNILTTFLTRFLFPAQFLFSFVKFMTIYLFELIMLKSRIEHLITISNVLLWFELP